MPSRRTAAAILFSILTVSAGVSACTGASEHPQPPGDPFSGFIRFYQGPLNHLSAVRRGACPMAPSCSEYARLAVAAHGPLIGWVMAHDRLLRCGRDEASRAPRVLVNGEWKIYDPPEANDSWWHDPAGITADSGGRTVAGNTRRPVAGAPRSDR